MDFSTIFTDLFSEVLTKERRKFGVSDHKIREAIKNMKEVYMPNPNWRGDQVVNVADYNDPAHRIAYVHKYALCYSGLVYTIMALAIQGSDDLQDYFESKKRLNLCSLGGGPGTDVVGVMAAILQNCDYIPFTVSVVDYFKEWKQTFSLIVQELRVGSSCEVFSHVVNPSSFKFEYLDANLLSGLSALAVQRAVASADLITMVKFISAAASQHTRSMIEHIFTNMKKGALLLFIDNAGGGFLKMLQQVASQYGMDTVFGPLQHFDYEDPTFSITRFGYTSQSKTKICAQIWQKPLGNRYNTTQQLRNEFFYPNRTQQQSTVRVDRPIQRAQVNYYERQENNNGCCTIM